MRSASRESEGIEQTLKRNQLSWQRMIPALHQSYGRLPSAKDRVEKPWEEVLQHLAAGEDLRTYKGLRPVQEKTLILPGSRLVCVPSRHQQLFYEDVQRLRGNTYEGNLLVPSSVIGGIELVPQGRLPLEVLASQHWFELPYTMEK